MLSRNLAVFLGVSIACLACSSANDGSTGEGEDDLRSTEKGFAYTCTAPNAENLAGVAKTSLLITSKHLRYDSQYGQNLGAIDTTYRAPSGTSRVRYDGFETGEDCTLRVVADKALLTGQPAGQLRLQCAGDDFIQNVFDCSGMTAATLRLPKPPAPPPAPPPAVTGKAWACTTTSEYATLEKAVTLKVDADRMEIANSEFSYLGTRDTTYKPRSGDYIGYEDFGYGGDCSLSVVVLSNVLSASTRSTTLKVRCAGEGFQQDTYTCKPK